MKRGGTVKSTAQLWDILSQRGIVFQNIVLTATPLFNYYFTLRVGGLSAKMISELFNYQECHNMEFEVLPTELAVALRKAFIQKFVDTTSEHYQKHIATLIQDIDGFYYDGYLWDCLQDNEKWKKECRMEDAATFLREKKNVFFMWDLFSKERLSGKRFSLEYPKAAAISIEGSLLGTALIAKTGRPPVGFGYIAQKNRPIFKDSLLRNVIVSIYFLVFSSKILRFRVSNKS